MNIEQLRDEKAKMEVAIMTATANAVAAFKQATGLTPSAVRVDMIAHNAFAVRRTEYIVGPVETEVDVLD